ncbi:hypothetical protein ScPMuIL_000118 [Solemya velum]
MDENELAKCMLGEKMWKCPVYGCDKILCRKQTLKSHILNQHNIQVGSQPKRYKLYETDNAESIPKTTQWRLKQRNQELPSSETGQSFNPPPIFESIDPSCTAFDSIAPEEIEIPLDTDKGVNMELEDDNESEEEFLMSESDLETSSEEEDNSCEPQVSPEELSSDPPLYIIPPSSTVYHSNISRTEHVFAISAFATRHNMSDTALHDLLQLIQLHLPDNNIGETKTDKIKESCGFDSNYLVYHFYCDKCKKLFAKDTDKCNTPGCEGSRKEKQCKNYFISGKINVQLKEILERDGIWSSIEESRSSTSENISDIKSASGYKKLQEPGGFLCNTPNITLSLFIDGIPLFKSSSVSLWPVYLLINEIAPKKRFSKKNMLLWGVWQGVGKPNMNMFLKPLVSDLVALYKNGFVLFSGQEAVLVKGMLIIATMDLQARAYVLMMTQHNGLNGCLYCMDPGEVVPSGKGHCRVYSCSEQLPVPRTDESARLNALAARQSGNRNEGFMGESVLWYLPYFSVTTSVVIDYMHGTLLGVSSKFLELWFDKKHSSEPYNIHQEMTEIDNDLKNIKPPYIIHRLPRVLTNTYSKWKASELRNWLLFYSLPCLKGRLPEIYLTHFSCLVEAIYLLLQEGINMQDLHRAKQLLQAFVTNVEQLYGKKFMSLNVHNLIHTVNLVELWGPLWAWSCFCFESFNGEIKKAIHGTGNVCRQIFWTCQAQKRVEVKVRQLPPGNKVRNYMQSLLEANLDKLAMDAEAFQCSVKKVPTCMITSHFAEEVKTQLRMWIGMDQESDFITVSKIVRNGHLMYSKVCAKVKKQNSYTIYLERSMNNEEDAKAIEVNIYIMEKITKKVFAIGRLLNFSGPILQRRVPHLQKTVFHGSEHNDVVPAEYLREPLMVINAKSGVYAALLPNKIERD